MRRIIMAIGTLVVALALVLVFGPREPVEYTGGALRLGPDLDTYLASREAAFDDLVSGAEKRILWADPDAKVQTPFSVVYIHGFSATSEEIRPVPDRVAQALGANLHFTRLAGHGRGGDAMAEATVPAWRADVAEALAIGRRIGEQVIVIATSTGASLVTLDLVDAEKAGGIAGVVFVAPNYGVVASGSELLTLPFARSWAPLLVGAERSWQPLNDAQARWWATRYPTQALVPMGASVAAARAVDHSKIETPALFIFSDSDQVVRADEIRAVAEAWGGPVTLEPVEPGAGDPSEHVVTGDILSPTRTEPTVARILDWVEGL